MSLRLRELSSQHTLQILGLGRLLPSQHTIPRHHPLKRGRTTSLNDRKRKKSNSRPVPERSLQPKSRHVTHTNAPRRLPNSATRLVAQRHTLHAVFPPKSDGEGRAHMLPQAKQRVAAFGTHGIRSEGQQKSKKPSSDSYVCRTFPSPGWRSNISYVVSEKEGGASRRLLL